MNWTKLSVATTMAAALIASPATANADCGDPGQDPCTGPVPTVDQVVAVMQQLTDPNIPAANKGNIVTPPFSPEEAATIDDHLRQMNASRILPLPFNVTDIQPAPNNFAGATVSVPGPYDYTPPGPIVLVDQGGHWLLTHHSAISTTDVFWYNCNRRGPKGLGTPACS
jgi:hypothetical protein